MSCLPLLVSPVQIAASPGVEYMSSDEISADVFEKEKEIEMGREDLQSKPEAIRAKIAEGRVKKLVQVTTCLADTSTFAELMSLFCHICHLQL